MTTIYDHSFRKIIFTLFCITGVSSIFYLLIWTRYFHLLFGDTTQSDFILFIAYISGLALGSYLGGMIIDTWRKEFKVFMYLEIATAIYGLILLFCFSALENTYRQVFQSAFEHSALISLVNYLFAFLFFLPLTLFIGAKFSVIGRCLIRSENLIAQEIGILHCCYILGTALGSIITIPFIFLLGTNFICYFAIFLNLLIAVATYFFSHRLSEPQNIVAEFYDQHLKYFSSLNKQFSPALISAIIYGNGISSFVITSYVVLMFQYVLQLTQHNILMQSFLISVILACFAAGSYLSTKLIREDRNLLMKFIVFQCLMGIFILITAVYLPKIISFNYTFNLNDNFIGYFARYLDVFILILLPLAFLGILFPIMFKIYLIKFEHIGLRIGSFYALFFVGIILGYLFTTFILMPLLSITNGFISIVVITFALVSVLMLKTQRLSLHYNLLVICSLFLLVILCYIFLPDFYKKIIIDDEIVQVKDWRNNMYTVTKDNTTNDLFLGVNGSIVCGTSLPYITSNRMLAHIPMLINQKAQSVFINGFGNGEIVGIVAAYNPSVIDYAETSKIKNLSGYFTHVNFNVTQNRIANHIPVDGVTFLHLTNRMYDVILHDYTFSESHDNLKFYTKDYFRDCQAHLHDGGVFALQVPLLFVSFDHLQVLINTFCSVFEHTSLWFNNNYLNCSLLIVGCKDKEFKINFRMLYEKLGNEAILQNLAEINLNNIYEILDCYICGPNSLGRFIGNNTANSVNKPNFRLSVNSTSYNMVDLRPYLRLFKEVKEPVLYLLKDVESSLEGADIVRAILNMFYKSSNYIFEGLLYEFDRDLQNALQTFRLAYQTNKLDYGAKRFLDAYYDLQLINEPKTAVELTENAKILYQKMEYQKAVDVLKEALKVDSRYAPAYFGLGINYEIMNDVQMAKQMYRRTLRLKPQLKPAEERLNKILTQEKEFEDQFRRGIFNKSN